MNDNEQKSSERNFKCCVTNCPNQQHNKSKTYIRMPCSPAELKRNWCIAVFGYYFASSNHFYVCEDHFDMQHDMENYMAHKLMGMRLRPKRGAVPHLNMRPKTDKEDYPSTSQTGTNECSEATFSLDELPTGISRKYLLQVMSSAPFRGEIRKFTIKPKPMDLDFEDLITQSIITNNNILKSVSVKTKQSKEYDLIYNKKDSSFLIKVKNDGFICDGCGEIYEEEIDLDVHRYSQRCRRKYKTKAELKEIPMECNANELPHVDPSTYDELPDDEKSPSSDNSDEEESSGSDQEQDAREDQENREHDARGARHKQQIACKECGRVCGNLAGYRSHVRTHRRGQKRRKS